MNSNFNWSWINKATETKNDSFSIKKDTGVVYTFRQASKGSISATDLNLFSVSVAENISQEKYLWNNYTRIILNSLPHGTSDKRWETAVGTGLPNKIDCFKFGIQGSTLFVFNDADSSKADGWYWVDKDSRPKTIAEAIQDLRVEISNISTASSTSTYDLDPLWAAIGENYRNSNMVGLSGSLDIRLSTVESYFSQLETDIYDPSIFYFGLGNPPPYSLALMLDNLLKLHNAAGFGADPSVVNHNGLPVEAHYHSFSEITPPPASNLTQDRLTFSGTLETEIKRLRYEIQMAKGSTSWYSDAIDPVSSGGLGLKGHMDYVGTGTVSSTNPHGMSLNDIGASTILSAIVAYTGMESDTDNSPSYNSNNYILNGDALTSAISKLDEAISTAIGSNVVRVDYSYDRSYMSETSRDQNPITITHNMGRKPLVQVTDVSESEQDYYGQYISPDVYMNIVHVSDDEFEIWTNAATIEVVAIY
jgi:hypothetical protein